MKTKRKSFAFRCSEVAESLDIMVHFYPDCGRKRQFEDDGSLHIYQRGQRACFDVSNTQGDEPAEQNKKTRQVMDMLGLEVTEACLVDETDED